MSKPLPKPSPPSGTDDKSRSPRNSSSSRPSKPSKPSTKKQAELAGLRLRHGLLVLEQQIIQQRLHRLDLSDSTLEDELAEIHCDYLTSCNSCLNATVTATATMTKTSVTKAESMVHVVHDVRGGQQDKTGKSDDDNLVEMPAPPSRSVSPAIDDEATEIASLSSPDTRKQLKAKRQVRFA